MNLHIFAIFFLAAFATYTHAQTVIAFPLGSGLLSSDISAYSFDPPAETVLAVRISFLTNIINRVNHPTKLSKFSLPLPLPFRVPFHNNL